MGRYFTDLEILSTGKVVIIGETVRRELFGLEDPIGETILINNTPFIVIGVLSEVGRGFSGRDFDNLLVIPYTTCGIKVTNRRNFDEIYIATHTDQMVDETVDIVTQYFRRVHAIPHDSPNDFKIKTSKEKLKIAEDISNMLSILLAGIASISLFVGGVGIMNIMLVSVSERTREIGIRMAIGAKRRDILIQFLIESVTLSSVGGIVGIILGLRSITLSCILFSGHSCFRLSQLSFPSFLPLRWGYSSILSCAEGIQFKTDRCAAVRIGGALRLHQGYVQEHYP
jgi:putative ABC transport system permease protein